jgi:hypothetical protein
LPDIELEVDGFEGGEDVGGRGDDSWRHHPDQIPNSPPMARAVQEERRYWNNPADLGADYGGLGRPWSDRRGPIDVSALQGFGAGGPERYAMASRLGETEEVGWWAG